MTGELANALTRGSSSNADSRPRALQGAADAGMLERMMERV